MVILTGKHSPVWRGSTENIVQFGEIREQDGAFKGAKCPMAGWGLNRGFKNFFYIWS